MKTRIKDKQANVDRWKKERKKEKRKKEKKKERKKKKRKKEKKERKKERKKEKVRSCVGLLYPYSPSSPCLFYVPPFHFFLHVGEIHNGGTVCKSFALSP